MLKINNDRYELSQPEMLFELKKSFEKNNYFILRNIFPESIKSKIQETYREEGYEYRSHVDSTSGRLIAEEYALKISEPVCSFLWMQLNNESFIKLIKHITLIDNIISADGRVYQFRGEGLSVINWHDDVTEDNDRLLGFSINLSQGLYEGGEFLIRDKQSRKLYGEIHHQGWGDGHFFRISPELQHKVNDVSGDIPRTAYAGWYLSTGTIDKYFNCI